MLNLSSFYGKLSFIKKKGNSNLCAAFAKLLSSLHVKVVVCKNTVNICLSLKTRTKFSTDPAGLSDPYIYIEMNVSICLIIVVWVYKPFNQIDLILSKNCILVIRSELF